MSKKKNNFIDYVNDETSKIPKKYGISYDEDAKNK